MRFVGRPACPLDATYIRRQTSMTRVRLFGTVSRLPNASNPSCPPDGRVKWTKERRESGAFPDPLELLIRNAPATLIRINSCEGSRCY